jgi:hypothetical protein
MVHLLPRQLKNVSYFGESMGRGVHYEFRVMVLGSLAVSVLAPPAPAQDTMGPAPPATTSPTPQDLTKEKQNPFSEETSLPITATTGFGVGANRNTGEELSIQPRFSLPLSTDWNLIVRPLLPVSYLPAPDKRFGVGDIQPSFFLTPARVGAWTWGVGPALQLPTATADALGTGKWSAGPTGALIYSEGPWFAGVLVTQLWSFAGAHRGSVNQTSIEPNVSYSFKSGWYVLFDPGIIYDWSAASRDAWTLPIGLDVGKAVKVGAQSLTFQIGAYDAVRRPTDAAQWIIRAQLTFLFPRS